MRHKYDIDKDRIELIKQFRIWGVTGDDQQVGNIVDMFLAWEARRYPPYDDTPLENRFREFFANIQPATAAPAAPAAPTDVDPTVPNMPQWTRSAPVAAPPCVPPCTISSAAAAAPPDPAAAAAARRVARFGDVPVVHLSLVDRTVQELNRRGLHSTLPATGGGFLVSRQGRTATGPRHVHFYDYDGAQGGGIGIGVHFKHHRPIKGGTGDGLHYNLDKYGHITNRIYRHVYTGDDETELADYIISLLDAADRRRLGNKRRSKQRRSKQRRSKQRRSKQRRSKQRR
jgi:hypothetical protein